MTSIPLGAPLAAPRHSKKTRTKVQQVITTGVVVTGACMLLVPLIWMIRTSLMSPGQIFLLPMRWLPDPVRWANYREAVTEIAFWTYFKNSLRIAMLTVVGSALSSSLVAYAFARLRAPDKDVLFMIVLGTMMLPGEVTMIPSFLLFRALRWVGTILPLVVPSYLGGGAFFIFLLRQFFSTIPLELDDAAKMDGAGLLRIYWDLILPLSKPALATVGIFSFFWSWNEFLGPLIYLDSMEQWTLPLGLKIFAGAGVYAQAKWHLLMAASLLAMLPSVIFFFFAQRTFVRGIVLTGLKG
jgi:ABC-type glycerol-3-phosphate transport system permease component